MVRDGVKNEKLTRESGIQGYYGGEGLLKVYRDNVKLLVNLESKSPPLFKKMILEIFPKRQ